MRNPALLDSIPAQRMFCAVLGLELDGSKSNKKEKQMRPTVTHVINYHEVVRADKVKVLEQQIADVVEEIGLCAYPDAYYEELRFKLQRLSYQLESLKGEHHV